MMKKLICLIITVSVLAGFSAQAVTLNEWNFYSDPAGKTLSNAFNSAGTASFALNPGYNDTSLRTDGSGSLICTNNDLGTNGMWSSGSVLDATTSNLTSGTFFLRYDFKYDLSATNNNSGTLLGFAFTDATGSKVAGAALQYDLGAANTPSNLTVTPLADLGTNYTGNVSIITKVDMATQKLAVWYDLTGAGSFSAETSPQASNITVNLPSIDKLRLQATGDFSPAGSDDSASISLLRMTDSFADAASSDLDVPAARYSNEWTFERDVNGLPLSDTINSGTNSPLAQFSTGFGSTVFTTNRALVCIGNDTGTGDVWTNGAVLNAALPSATSGVHYLRYDLNYDLSSTNNDNGTVLGVYFTGATGDKAAGLILGYDPGNLTSLVPTNRTLTTVTNNLALAGSLTAIAEVNLSAHTLKVWYDVNGSSTFDTNAPNASASIPSLSSITNLRFHATGDFRPAASSNYASVDNIRHTASWSEIIEPTANLEAPPKLSISVSNSLNGVMEVGSTNIVTVVIHNSGGLATNVTSTLTHDGLPASFTIVSNNTPAPLDFNASITHTYILTANANNKYIFTAQANAGTNSATTNLDVVVGAQIRYDSHSITQVPGTGVISNKYEPGEIIRITVTSTNDGSRTVTNVVNTLSADPSYFTILPASATYPSVAKNGSTSTVYAVTIASNTPPANYTFHVANQEGSLIWTNSFELAVFKGALPSVVTTNLTIVVPAGGTASGTMILTNSGNDSATFSISDDGALATSYSVTNQTTNLVSFGYEGIPFINWDSNGSATTNIGFVFPFYGTNYTSMSVSRYGAISFGTSVVANIAADLPFGSDSVVAPFWGTITTATNSIRYLEMDDKLVVYWSSPANKGFQAWLYKNGQIRYVYQDGPWTDSAAVGIQRGTNSLNVADALPTNIWASSSNSPIDVLLTPQSWVTHTPTNGTVAGPGSSVVTFTANAAEKSAGTNRFNAFVTWGDGTISTVAVTVVVSAPLSSLPGLDINPSSVMFNGAAGSIAHTNVLLINTGNVALAYTITDLGAKTNGHVRYVNSKYDWQNIWSDPITSWTNSVNGIYSQAIPTKFPLPFFGNIYTQLFIGVNGLIVLGDSGFMTKTNAPDHFIAPYLGNLVLDENAGIGYSGDANQIIITWANMSQAGGGSNQTFQAILNRDGSIRFQYSSLTGSNVWPNTHIGLGDTPVFESTTLSNETTTVLTNIYTYTTNTIVTTNIWAKPPVTTTNVVTTTTNTVRVYKNEISNQEIFIQPNGRVVITAEPFSGIIQVGGTNTVTLYGDARSLTFTNGGFSVTNSTTFGVNYAAGTNSLSKSFSATFVATNSGSGGFPPIDRDAIAGTDEFIANVSQQRADGSRTISWPAPNDSLSRTYKVLYTLDLMQDFQVLAIVSNGTSYVDTTHTDVPVIYYKVTVE